MTRSIVARCRISDWLRERSAERSAARLGTRRGHRNAARAGSRRPHPHADREGRRSRAAGTDRAHARHPRRAAGDRPREGGAGRRRGAAAARAGGRAGRGHPAGAIADRNGPRRSRRPRDPNSMPPNRISSASTRCSRTTPARASSATMRRRGGMWRRIACRRGEPGEVRGRNARELRPAPGRRKSKRRARVSPSSARRSPRSKKDSPTPPCSRRSPASSPRSSSKSAK